MKMRYFSRITALCILSLAVISCGGGSGGNDNGGSSQSSSSSSTVPAFIYATDGNQQKAAPGSTLAIAPTVVVKDSAGTPLSAVGVSCAITAGGGSIQNTNVLTDAAGRAVCGVWTLGSTKGINSLTVSVPGQSSVVFSATAALTSPAISVSILNPVRNGLTTSDSLETLATVTSTYALTSVTASVNGVSTPLVYGSYWPPGIAFVPTNGWAATLSLVGQPSGQTSLVITATDILGNVTDAVVDINLDRKPVISVTAPLEWTVVRPNLSIAATCTDDLGCRSLKATLSDNTVIASGTNSISGTFDLSAYEGRMVSIAVTAVDSLGQSTVIGRNVFVESSSHLVSRATVTGSVWDASSTHVLFVDSSGTTPALKVQDIASGTQQTIETTTDLVAGSPYGYLTSTGAVYVRNTLGTTASRLYEWRAGSVTDLGALNSAQSLQIAGDWAIYNTGSGLWRRDLLAGVSTQVSAAAGNWRNGVAANGDVAYWTNNSGYNIYRLRGGSTQQLTNDATLWNTYPVTDGVNVVYRKSTQCCSTQTFQIAMHDGISETILTPTAVSQEPTPGADYAAAGGYVGYVRSSGAGAFQVWRHSPGTDQQLTFFGGWSTIDAMAPDGTIVLSSPTVQRYMAVPGAALQPISSSLGRVVFRNGKFLTILGRSVFEIAP